MEKPFPVLLKDEIQYMLLRIDWTWMTPDLESNIFNKGSLWKSNIDDQGTVQHFGKEINVEWESCPKRYFAELSELEFGLLLGVRQDADRYLIHSDKVWLSEGRELDIGDAVKIQNVDYLSHATGCIQFKDRAEEKSGILFGVELSDAWNGNGTSNGSFKNRRYFQCNDNCAVFYSLKFIRRKNTVLSSDSFTESSLQLSLRSNQSNEANPVSLLRSGVTDHLPHSELPVTVGEDVIWPSDDGPERGTIRWFGQIPDLDPIQKWYAGVEFEKPIGKGTGKYKGKQLFVAKKDHASLVPLVGLIRYSDTLHFRDQYGSIGSDDTFVPYRESFFGAAPGAHTMSTYQVDGRKVSSAENVNVLSADSTKHTEVGRLKSSSARYASGQNNASLASLHGDGTDDSINIEKKLQRRQMLQCSQQQRPQPELPEESLLRTCSSSDVTLTKERADTAIFKLGDRVQVLSPPRFGVIRWFGEANAGESSKKTGPITVGLEMELADPQCYTDGMLKGKKIFNCEPHRAFFIYLSKCQRAPREDGTD